LCKALLGFKGRLKHPDGSVLFLKTKPIKVIGHQGVGWGYRKEHWREGFRGLVEEHLPGADEAPANLVLAHFLCAVDLFARPVLRHKLAHQSAKTAHKAAHKAAYKYTQIGK
jgi:hypothetical protein